MNEKILFQEKQKFTQWWLWLILLTPIFLILYYILAPMAGENSEGSGFNFISSIIPNEIWIVIAISLLVLLFFYFITMRTLVDSNKIVVSHLYFVNKEWYWKDVESAEIIKYGFVGYGLRISLNHGTVYNVKGNMGLLLKLKNGKKRLIGTQKPDELKSVVKKVLD